jgi:hypothetical protein
MYQYILIYFVIICVILLLLLQNNNNKEYFTPNPTKPIIWSYWENKPGVKKPEYIDLCFDTFYKHNPDFDIRILNEKTLYDYLPDMRNDMGNLTLAQKSDYIRILLLYTYGGIWLDADTIVMKNLMPIINKLNEGFLYDFCGFGCSYTICNDKITGYPKPSNGAMAAQKNSILMKKVLEKLNNFVDKNKNNKFGHFDMGKLLIWNSIDELQKEINYKYYHYNSSVDGSRDKNGTWINVDNHIDQKYTELLNDQNLFVVFLENNKFMGKDNKYNWFSNLNKKQILEGPWWISELFRRSLGYK